MSWQHIAWVPGQEISPEPCVESVLLVDSWAGGLIYSNTEVIVNSPMCSLLDSKNINSQSWNKFIENQTSNPVWHFFTYRLTYTSIYDRHYGICNQLIFADISRGLKTNFISWKWDNVVNCQQLFSVQTLTMSVSATVLIWINFFINNPPAWAIHIHIKLADLWANRRPISGKSGLPSTCSLNESGIKFIWSQRLDML